MSEPNKVINKMGKKPGPKVPTKKKPTPVAATTKAAATPTRKSDKPAAKAADSDKASDNNPSSDESEGCVDSDDDSASKGGKGTRFFVLESTQGDRYAIDMKAKWQMETLIKVNTKDTKEFVIPMTQVHNDN